MKLFLKKAGTYGLVLCSTLIYMGCSQQSDAPPQKTAEQIQAEKIAEEQEIKENQRQIAQIDAELQKATPDQIRSIQQSCKSAILDLAKSRNTSPFEVFLVDEYSADVYQAAAYTGSGNVTSDEERVKRFLKSRKAGENLQSALSLSYSVMFTHDRFSGPQKEPKNFMCVIKPGLNVIAI